MKTYCFVRLDDLCPTMDMNQFKKALDFLASKNIKPLLGVIPNNMDNDLKIDEEMDCFWNYIIELKNKGYSIAMHGFTHVYDQEKPKTLLCGRKHSEFAGNDFDNQNYKIKTGKEILNNHGIYTNVFFAPAHTFDKNTVLALKKNGFEYISDGYSKFSYKKNGVTFVPCRSFGVPLKAKSGINTIVCHPNEWSKNESEFYKLVKFCNENKNIVSFDEIIKLKNGNGFVQMFREKVIVILKKIKHIFF